MSLMDVFLELVLLRAIEAALKIQAKYIEHGYKCQYVYIFNIIAV